MVVVLFRELFMQFRNQGAHIPGCPQNHVIIAVNPAKMVTLWGTSLISVSGFKCWFSHTKPAVRFESESIVIWGSQGSLQARTKPGQIKHLSGFDLC